MLWVGEYNDQQQTGVPGKTVWVDPTWDKVLFKASLDKTCSLKYM